MAAIYKTLAIFAIGAIEMYLGRILPQTRCQHMLCVFNRAPIHMVDLFANLIVCKAVIFARSREIIAQELKPLG